MAIEKNWTQHTLKAKCLFVPDKTGYDGAAGMVSIELVEPGVAWVDDLSLALVAS